MSRQTRQIEEAAREYIARQNRNSHPDGTFDRAGRFYPADDERRPCCAGIRPPSRAYPYSEMTHCRSALHVARLFAVDRTEMMRAVRGIRAAQGSGADRQLERKSA